MLPPAFEVVVLPDVVLSELELVGTSTFEDVAEAVETLVEAVEVVVSSSKKISFWAPSANPHFILYAGLFGCPARSYPLTYENDETCVNR